MWTMRFPDWMWRRAPRKRARLPLTSADRDGVAAALREWIGRYGSWKTTFQGRSMEPSILGGALLCVEGLPQRLQPADLLVFVHEVATGVCCHRVIAMYGDGRVVTQGDNVAFADGVIDPARFVGVVRRYRLGGRWYAVSATPRVPSGYRRLRHRLTRYARRLAKGPP